MGKHLSNASRLELRRPVLHGMVQFWISIFPIPTIVINKINSLCRSFLCSRNSSSCHYALIAWYKVCLPKVEGGLVLLDIKAKNRSFLAKQLWNIHLKSNSLWIKWIDHFYISHNSVWVSDMRKSSSPPWKSICSFRNQLLALLGEPFEVIATLQSWHNEAGTFIANAHEFFHFKDNPVSWTKVVWEKWSLLRYNFILWLAVLGKLGTRDRLTFLSNESLCTLCSKDDESHAHLFFSCD